MLWMLYKLLQLNLHIEMRKQTPRTSYSAIGRSITHMNRLTFPSTAPHPSLSPSQVSPHLPHPPLIPLPHRHHAIIPRLQLHLHLPLPLQHLELAQLALPLPALTARIDPQLDRAAPSYEPRLGVYCAAVEAGCGEGRGLEDGGGGTGIGIEGLETGTFWEGGEGL